MLETVNYSFVLEINYYYSQLLGAEKSFLTERWKKNDKLKFLLNY